LSPQIGSVIRFPAVELRFGNGIELLEAEVAAKFPRESDGFRKLQEQLTDYDELDQTQYDLPARPILRQIIRDPLLVEMLLCPLMWYGNSRPHDMSFGMFCVMFRSIFLEGFSRPLAGVRLILKNLIKRFRSLGGELKLRAGVERIKVEGDRAVGVVLEDGTELTARRILSSAGLVETLRMCDGSSTATVPPGEALSFAESISVLDRQPRDLGHDRTIVFYNDSEQFHWDSPRDELLDVRTGVICSPNNYQYADEAGLPEGVIRITAQANFDRWMDLSEDEYQRQKLRWYDRMSAAAVRFMPDFRSHVIDTDMFTPKTIRRFTWHDRGGVYGAPDKRLDGTTHLKNLFLCGNDQGFVGIVGSIVSGITIANRHCLQD
jgi:phytoene dehydrogenase-like protein